MIAPQCAIPACGKELDRYGGIMFSPPFGPEEDQVRKLHLCVKCWNDVLMMLGIPLT